MVKVKWIYIAPSRETSKALRHGSHSFTGKQHHACLYLVCIHQMAPPLTGSQTSNCSLLLVYLPQKDERLSWPVTNIIAHATKNELVDCQRVKANSTVSILHRLREIHYTAETTFSPLWWSPSPKSQ